MRAIGFACFCLILLQCPSLRASVSLPISVEGLRAKVSPFTIGTHAFQGGEVDLIPDRVQYLVVNLKTGNLHALPRIGADGEIPLVRLETSLSEVAKLERLSEAIPQTRIPRALEKLSRGEPLRVHCFGTSLVEGGLSAHGWQRMLFDPKQPVARFRVGENIASRSFAVGGSNAHYTIGLMGAGSENGHLLKTPSYDCDLAIIGLLPNGGNNRLAIFEGIVRLLRSHGVEVLLVTDNAFANRGETCELWKDGEFVRQMATAYGCGLADSAAYMREAELRGVKVYSDSIHPSEMGHVCWAEAVAGALTPAGSPAMAAPPLASTTLQTAENVPGGALVDFSPVASQSSHIHAPGNRLAKVFSASDSTSTELNPGDSVQISRKGAIACDLMFDASSSFVADLRRSDDNEVVRTLTYRAPEKVPSRPQTMTVTAKQVGAADPSELQVTIREGKLVLYGVIYQQPLVAR